MVACCAEADPGPAFATVCGFLFHLREVCSEPGLQWVFSRLRRSADYRGPLGRTAPAIKSSSLCSSTASKGQFFNRCLFLLLLNIVLKILDKKIGQETKLRNAMIVNEKRTIIYKW